MSKEQVVSLSGGKDSTAMLLMMLEKGERVDEVVTFDFGMEYPEMYEHLNKLERYVGFSFTKLKPPHSFSYYMFEHRKQKGSHVGELGYSWPTPTCRWCTRVKTTTIDSHLKGREVIQCIGIAADEPKRIRDKRYPLVEYGVTEKMALEYCYKHGFDWGGLYEMVDRLSCWCCPLQSLKSLRTLRKTHPELWLDLLDMDSRSKNDFRFKWPVERYEKRFANEDLQTSLSLGGSQ